MKTSVGTSSRTPYKHWLFNYMLGKVIGAISTGRTPCAPRITILDLCAGDGDNGQQSSPGIIHKHIHSRFHGSHRMEKRVAHLWEREESTFNRLSLRYKSEAWMSLKMEDSKGFVIGDISPTASECVFVYADPNSITTLPVTPELVDSFTPETLFLMTLGCNVGGCKRLPREDREAWRKTANMVADRMHYRHDLMLLWLLKDASQWAYLASFPQAWSGVTLQTFINKGNAMWPNGVGGISLRQHGREALREKFDDLFLTVSELEQTEATAR